ncbi:hypothetical protein F9L07_08585 [Pimelobacter simplex]|uniref:Uncharacterized protein n=1 Tax=Nocardioides simplex TaxID=2045 RepID=A0A7J5E0U3_NOCSI|nr:hypothetical protein [Pimelobacter simplex]KAB2811886.1 hypothetical protein F9L07_08585 [Pimelobacter simplex]
MRPRHAWTAGGLGAAALLAVLVTRTFSSSGWPFNNLWPWLALGMWLVLTLTGMGLAGWAWRSWRRAVAALGAALLLATLGAWSMQTTLPRLGVVRDHEAWFEAHRADFVTAASRGSGVDAATGSRLPDDLRYLSIDGRVSRTDGNALFFAQWTAIPDDAGGFWFSPERPPSDFDMYGMLCTNPVDLGDGWWSCGM